MRNLIYISLICLLSASLFSCEKDELEGCDKAAPEMRAVELDDQKESPSVNQLHRDKVSPNPRENGDSGVNDDGDDESGNPSTVKAK